MRGAPDGKYTCEATRKAFRWVVEMVVAGHSIKECAVILGFGRIAAIHNVIMGRTRPQSRIMAAFHEHAGIAPSEWPSRRNGPSKKPYRGTAYLGKTTGRSEVLKDAGTAPRFGRRDRQWIVTCHVCGDPFKAWHDRLSVAFKEGRGLFCKKCLAGETIAKGPAFSPRNKKGNGRVKLVAGT